MKISYSFSPLGLLIVGLLVPNLIWGQSQSQMNTQSGSSIVSGKDAYEQNFPGAFATAYHIDGAALKVMIQQGAHSARVYNGLTDNGSHVFVLMPVNTMYKKMTGQNYVQYSSSLCPPNCDLPITPAIQIDPTMGAKYINNFSKSSQPDPVKGFIIKREIINEAGLGKNLRVYNVMMEGRTVALRTVDLNGIDTGEMGWVQEASSLCPPNCD